jgi:hypothetical protein
VAAIERIVGKTSEFYAAIPKETPDRITVFDYGGSVVAVISGTKSAGGSPFVETLLTVVAERPRVDRVLAHARWDTVYPSSSTPSPFAVAVKLIWNESHSISIIN